MPKKDFSNRPAMTFISQESIEHEEEKNKPEVKEATASTSSEAQGGAHYIVREAKSKRVQLLVQPSLYKDAKAEAEALGVSFNDFLHRALREATYNDYVGSLIAKDIKEGK